MFLFLIQLIVCVILILLAAAFLILLERKVMGGIQRRKGPNVVGFVGLLQPISDAFKLIVKEVILPKNANTLLFLISPLVTIILSFGSWTFVLPDLSFGFPGLMLSNQTTCSILYIFAISSLGVYAILLAGLASNNAYAFLGALRTVAQMLSYEVFIGLSLLPLLINNQTMNLSVLVVKQQFFWNIFTFLPCFFFFFIALLAETNRAPFDLPEAEGELVAGFNVEYSGIFFTLFFLGEYINILFVCVLTTLLFFGGHSSFGILESLFGVGFLYYFSIVFLFGFKVSVLCFSFIWVRATLPRFKYDQLLYIAWKNILPLLLSFVFWYASIHCANFLLLN